MDAPEIRYAKSGEVHVAYQVVGDGPLDLIYGLPSITHLAVWWEEPQYTKFWLDVSSFARVILFDKRGVGLSDRDVGIPTLEERMDDFRAVMDAEGSRKAVLVGVSESAAMSILFAAAHPERTLGLILVGGSARELYAPDYPWGYTLEDSEKEIRKFQDEWGKPSLTDGWAAGIAPSKANDPEFKRWWARLVTFGGSPSSASALIRMNREIDVRSVLPTIHVPTLVLAGRSGTDIEQGKYIAERIPGAQFVELSARDHYFVVDPEGTRAVIHSIRDFMKQVSPDMTSVPQPLESERVLTTVLFTDIVESTRRATELGDLAWSKLLNEYQEKARTDLARYKGRLIKSTGDGLLAIFDGPTRAVRCACALRDEARTLGLETRAGLHSGECLLREGDVEGIAVHIAARVNELAEDGDVLVSGTVRDLSAGSEVKFVDRGMHTLKGVAGEWRTFAVENT
ncbi:MAG: adenylate/guanylate cyclase domain-containing protein [archaeon]|nr:adenylate/guanylate cyclase domain-containing protein [archaeon]